MKPLRKGDKILGGLYEIRDIAENGASLDYKAGGAALVYKAHHTKWNIDMAVKIPKEEILRSKNGIEDFQRECTTWMELGIHPNIAFCYYAREIDGCLAAFSEWEDGGTLMDAVKGPLYENKSEADAQKEILHIAIQTMRGLEYAHSQDVVHKDIKPGNILVANGGIRINDFGLSNSLTNAPTKAFASPEQLNGRIGGQIGSGTDIYSWAITVMTMYIGKVKWSYGTIAGKTARDLLADSSCRLKAPETMITLLCQCLKREPGERPCAAELLPELTEIYEQTFGEKYPHPTGHGGGAETAGLLNNRALSYIDMGKREEAEECWKKALTITPNHAESLYNMAISKDKIYFDELLALMKDNGIFPEDHREIFDEICHASGLQHINSFPADTDRELKSMSFGDDGRYLMHRYNDDDTVYSLDTKTGTVEPCKESVRFRDEKTGGGSDPMRAEYDMDGRTLILSESSGSAYGQVNLEDRIDGKLRRLHIFEFTKAPFCMRPDGKAVALYFVLPLAGEEQKEIQLFSVPEPYSCKHILSKVFHLNDTLENFKSAREMLEKAEAETERGNYREAVDLLNRVKNIPDFENQWERFYRLKQKIAPKCRRSNPHFCRSISIEPDEGVIACTFSPDSGKMALVLVGGTVEIREITTGGAPLILTIRPSDKFPMEYYLNYSLDIDAWFSKDGKYVSVGCWPFESANETKTALIYDIEKGMFNGAKAYSDICGELCENRKFPYDLTYSSRHNVQAFSGDGAVLVSFDFTGYDDRTVMLYYLDYDLEYIPVPEPADPPTDRIYADDEINAEPNYLRSRKEKQHMSSSDNYKNIPGYGEDNHFLFEMLEAKGKLHLLKELAGVLLDNPFNKFDNNEKFLEHFKDSKTTAMCLNDDLVKLLNATKEEKKAMRSEKNTQSGLWTTSGITSDKADFLTLFVNSIMERAVAKAADDYANSVDNGDDESAVGFDDPVFSSFSGETDANKRRRDELPVEVSRLKDMRDWLSGKIIGQEHAIQAFITGMFRTMTRDASESRKSVKAIYTFAGPPGVGKTYLAQSASEILGLPFKKFDMTEYSDRNSTVALIGFEYGWKDAGPGVLTEFVRENPNAVLLFDEIEKAHSEVLMLFYQILDGGYLVDKHYESMKNNPNPGVSAKALEPKVDFKDTVIIFTSNVGRSIYEDENYINGAEVSEQTLLNALRTEKNLERGGENFFPAALVSRISTGTVVMFNQLEPPSLTRIAENIFRKVSNEFMKRYNIEFAADKKLFLTLLFSVGGQADARMLTAKTDSFFRDEIFKILKAEPNGLINIDTIKFEVEIPKPDIGDNSGVSEQDNAKGTVSSENEIYGLYYPEEKLNILAYARSYDINALVKTKKYNIFSTDNDEEAAAIAANQNIDLILIDISLQKNDSYLTAHSSPNASIWKVGKGLFDRLRKMSPEVPIYLLDIIADTDSKTDNGDPLHPLPQELINGFVRNGARGVIKITLEDDLVQKTVADICDTVYMQKSAGVIARGHRQLDFETAFVIPEEGGEAVIKLRNLELNRAPLADDVKTLLKDIDVPKDRFDDVVGAKSAKEALKYYKSFFENPRKFTADGRKAPKGVLLYGSPGTGKTMLARAMAGECGVTFIPTTAAELRSQNDVKKLFSTARKYAPAIIFVDEADTFGKQRTGSGSYTEDILNSVLAEMDGFKSDTRYPVFVLAATNYGISGDSSDLIGVMDEAFVRRFDRRIRIELPDTEERGELVSRFLKRLGKDRHTVTQKQIEDFAGRTPGLSPSQINNVLELALQMSHGPDKLNYKHINEAYENWKSGAKKSDPDKETLKRIACHESGHALINWLCGHTPSYLTIEARRNYGGYMEHSEEEVELSNKNKTFYLDAIRCALGGRAAEIVYYGREDGVNVGACADLESATRSARNMVCLLGMDEEFGMAVMDIRVANNSEKLRERINKILNEELEKAIKNIEDNKPKMNKLINALVKKKWLSRDEIKKILTKEN